MTREIAHQKSFEKALYSITDNFPPGKLPGVNPYQDMYINTSQGEGDLNGPWNSGNQWTRIDDVEGVLPLDGGNGIASVNLPSGQLKAATAMMARLQSVPDSNPDTGVDLGAGPGAGKITDQDMGGAADIQDARTMAMKKTPK